MSKKIGPLIDKLFLARADRLRQQKIIDDMKRKEEQVREEIMAILEADGLEGAKGRMATAAITRTTVGNVTDWDALYKYIKKTGEFDLMQKRLTDTAYRERLENGVVVPGVEPFIVKNISLTKSSKE